MLSSDGIILADLATFPAQSRLFGLPSLVATDDFDIGNMIHARPLRQDRRVALATGRQEYLRLCPGPVEMAGSSASTRELVGDLIKRLTHGIIQQMSVSGRGLGLCMSQ